MFLSRRDGNATVGEPESGFVSPALKDLFFPPSQSSTKMGSKPTATPTPLASPSQPGTKSDMQSDSQPAEKRPLSGGAKAGVAIGVIFGLAALLGLALLFLRRRRRAGEVAELEGVSSEMHLPMYGKPAAGVHVSELPVSEYEKSEHGRSVTESHDAAPVEMSAGVVAVEMAAEDVDVTALPAVLRSESGAPAPGDAAA